MTAGAVSFAPRVETERLVLRAWRESDVEPFVRFYSDPEVMRHIGDGKTSDRMGTWNAVARAIGHWVLRGYGQWVVERKDTGETIGRAGLYNPQDWPGLEAGWTLGREHWGNGFATEAGTATLRFAFDTVGAGKVISLIRPDNLASIRVAEKLGGTLEKSIDLMGNEALLYAYYASSTSSR